MPLVLGFFFKFPNSEFLLDLRSSFLKSTFVHEIMVSPFPKTMIHVVEGRQMYGEHYSARQEELHSKTLVQVKCQRQGESVFSCAV